VQLHRTELNLGENELNTRIFLFARLWDDVVISFTLAYLSFTFRLDRSERCLKLSNQLKVSFESTTQKQMIQSLVIPMHLAQS
jgi:hypothetical protein